MSQRIPHNIEAERSPFGDYRTAYGGGIVYKVTGRNGAWTARAALFSCQLAKAKRAPVLTAPTLIDLGAQLESLRNITEN